MLWADNLNLLTFSCSAGQMILHKKLPLNQAIFVKIDGARLISIFA